MNFNIIELEQQSKEWHEYRNTRVMASDIPSLMGVGYSTPKKLFEQKKNPSLSTYENDAMRRGKELEADAREWAEGELGTKFSATVVESIECPMFGASLDGLSELGTILEIKCPGYQVYKEFVKNGTVPKVWYYQIQWQLYITGFVTGHLCVYEGFTGKIMTIDRDQKLIDIMVPVAKEWLKQLLENNTPAAEEKDLILIDVSTEQLQVITRWKELSLCLKEVEQEEKVLSDMIKSWGDDGDCDFLFQGNHLISMTRVKRQGTVDWKALCVAKGITENDILPYRKEQIGYYKLVPTK